MKNALYISIVAVLIFLNSLKAQVIEEQDIVMLKNGKQYTGQIVEQIPGSSIKLMLPVGGDTLLFYIEQIEKIKKKPTIKKAELSIPTNTDQPKLLLNTSIIDSIKNNNNRNLFFWSIGTSYLVCENSNFNRFGLQSEFLWQPHHHANKLIGFTLGVEPNEALFNVPIGMEFKVAIRKKTMVNSLYFVSNIGINLFDYFTPQESGFGIGTCYKLGIGYIGNAQSRVRFFIDLSLCIDRFNVSRLNNINYYKTLYTEDQWGNISTPVNPQYSTLNDYSLVGGMFKIGLLF